MAVTAQNEATFLWHDYETWGINPRRDRASQFAGIRTNLDLEEIGEPMNLYCKPSDDYLPHPQACLITRITPQKAQAQGLSEFDFYRTINDAFMQPNTCGVGYNSIRFDDEVTRHGFFRNFMDPYAREWQNGNSRWDVMDLLRMAHALRPEGIHWPKDEKGKTTFRLEKLTAANNIAHDGAHDALSDVRATIAMARLVKQTNPRLFDFYFKLRSKVEAGRLLSVTNPEMLLHISGMYPSTQGCLSPVIPVLQHPTNKNEIIVYDLRKSPKAMLEMSVEALSENLFSKKADLPEGTERVGLKGVHLNKSPALAPMKTLSSEMAEHWEVDLAQCEQHRQEILNDADLRDKLMALYQTRQFSDDSEDMESALYSGFISNNDRKLCNTLLKKKPEQLASWRPNFDDQRLQAIYPRFIARNWPELLDQQAIMKWQGYCQARVLDGEYGSTITAAEYQDELEQLASQELSETEQKILMQLVQWLQR
ncbi:MAG: Exodeoxyribonuclease I (EC [uncultured Thiotrichaceae bacterium]|uniref:Exodeoxyribonuclease I n=1 Tax=uncultured Thiotrichaceae bacterium TaxID=298394 RepID=A0A6S6SB65_9GAMM|nr:MAG: Exodeoxyribonuclease I (EC [uncultured Thiotrichaceae bacterium]